MSETVTRYAASLNRVMNDIDEREEQLYALAYALMHQLTPPDEKNIPDGFPLTAWRLAQVLEDMLSSTAHRSSVRNVLMPGTTSVH